MNKRDIQLVDRSGCVVSCTLWGAEAEEFDGSGCPVIAIKGARVSDFGGRSLSTTMSGVMTVNPDIPEAHQLRGWFDSVGKNEDAQSISTQRMGGGCELQLSACTDVSVVMCLCMVLSVCLHFCECP